MRASAARFCFATALFALQALAQAPSEAQQPSTAEQQPASLRGVVVNTVTREPVPRAHVRAMMFRAGQPRTFGAMTTPDGRFSITGVPPGQYSLMVERPAFSAPDDDQAQTDTQIALRAGENREDLKLRLIPGGSVTGRVLDSAGEPVESVMVNLERGYGTRTDDEGRFRIGGVPPGKYRLKAEPLDAQLPPEIRTDGTTEVHHAPTYYPSSLTPKGAGRVVVQAGAETAGVEIRLVRLPIVRVSGTVAGAPPGAGGMHIAIESGGTSSGAAVKADGSFNIWRLAPGKYMLSALANTPTERLSTPAVEIEVGTVDIEGIVLPFGSPVNILGRIEEDGTAPVSNPARGRESASGAPPPPRSIAIAAGRRGLSHYPPAQIGSDGTFKIKSVSPNRYRLRLFFGPGYVKSVRTAKSETEGPTLDLTKASGDVEVTVVIGYATGEISGTVQGEAASAARTMVLLLTDEEGFGGFQRPMAMAGQDGSYVVKNVPPGRYKLLALPQSLAGTLYSSPSAMDEYADFLEAIEVQAGAKIVKDVRRYTPEDK